MHIPVGIFHTWSATHVKPVLTPSLIITYTHQFTRAPSDLFVISQLPANTFCSEALPWSSLSFNRPRSQRTRYSLCGSGTVTDLHVCLSVTEQPAGGFYFIAGRHEGKNPGSSINKQSMWANWTTFLLASRGRSLCKGPEGLKPPGPWGQCFLMLVIWSPFCLICLFGWVAKGPKSVLGLISIHRDKVSLLPCQSKAPGPLTQAMPRVHWSLHCWIGSYRAGGWA